MPPDSRRWIFLPVATFSMYDLPGPSSNTTRIPIFAIAAADAKGFVVSVTWNFMSQISPSDWNLMFFVP